MWCNNFLLLFPLRGGAMVWAAFIMIYSIVGGVFMFKYGEFLYFRSYEAQFFGGMAMAIAAIALLNLIGLMNNSYSASRIASFLWPVVVVISGVRAVLMIMDMNSNKPKIQWECDHGGCLYGATADQYAGGVIPSFDVSWCKYGVSGLYTYTVIIVLLDLACQVYMWFLNWRFLALLEAYELMIGPKAEVYYAP
ncbi:hypothetical protein DL93DRAFT_2071034 [Clavulina sp. PMI_390]|nr:hypothetical protein DL93DRAFT_2071034 [Clavulina sp. PMI_390]